MTGANVGKDSQSVVGTNVPSSARVYGYWLGGKDHSSAGQQIADVYPAVRSAARANRVFHFHLSVLNCAPGGTNCVTSLIRILGAWRRGRHNSRRRSHIAVRMADGGS